MTDKIIIFNTESTFDTGIVNKDTKEIFFLELEKKGIKNAKFFYEMEQYNDKHQFISSTIDTILFEQILPYVTPILEFIPHAATFKEKVEQDTTRMNHIVFKTEADITCFVANVEIKVSKFTYIDVIGIKINANLDRTDKFIYNYLVNAFNTINEKQALITSGSFSMTNSLVDKYFPFNGQLHFNTDSINVADLYLENGNIYFNGNNAIVLNSIINAIKAAREHYDHNNIVFYKTIHKQAVALNKPIKLTPADITKAKCSKVVTELGKITNHNFCYHYQQNILLDIFNQGYFIYYNKLQLTNDLSFYNEIKYTISINAATNKQNAALDIKQLEMFKRNNIAFSKFKINLAKATKEQLTIVDKIYKKSLEYIPPAESSLVYNLSNAMNLDDKQLIKTALDQLYKIKDVVKQKDKSDFIKINGKNLVCAHVIYKANLLLEDYQDLVSKNLQIRNQLVSKYNDSDISDGYFCGICGEKLVEKDNEFDIQRGDGYSAAASFDLLYTTIYREVTYIMNNFITFGNTHMQNITNIIRNVSDILKNEILDIQSNLLKVKTLGSEGIATVLSVYIYIYAFAFISQLIYTNEFISFKSTIFKGGDSPLIITDPVITQPQNIKEILKDKAVKSTRNIKNLQTIINRAITILKKIKYKDIQDSKIISLSSVNSLFLKAYRSITQINYTVIIDPLISYWDSNNTFLNYLLYAHKLANKSSYIDNNEDVIKQVLGRERADINKELKVKGIYDTLLTPETWSENKYINDSLLSLVEYIQKSLYLNNTPTKSAELVKFYKKYQYLHALEKEKIYIIKLNRLRPVFTTKYIPFQFEKGISAFKSCSCKNQTYIYQKIAKNGNFTKDKPIKVALNDITNWLTSKNYNKSKEFIFYTLTGITCSCPLAKYNYKSPFYDFYEVKCPLGNLHDFQLVKNESKCTKCALTQNIIATLDETYYKKYLPVYTAVKLKEYDNLQLMKPKLYKITKKTLPKLHITLQPIQKLASELQVPLNIIYNIGLSENKEYSEKVFEKVNMTNTATTGEILKQNNNLFDYYLFIIRNYYMLKNSENTPYLPVYLKDFLAKHKFTKAVYAKLVPINMDFLERYKYYKKYSEPKLITNFLICNIATLLLTISNILKTAGLKLASEIYIKMIFNMIITFEKKLSKYDTRKLIKNIVNSDKLEKQMDTEFIFESNGDQESNNELDDDADNRNKEVSDDEADVFSIGDLDLEPDEDNNYVDLGDRQN